jgi:hypothetical protein
MWMVRASGNECDEKSQQKNEAPNTRSLAAAAKQRLAPSFFWQEREPHTISIFASLDTIWVL